ncbi:uncharacterized protein LOC131439441 [Malaya genurostris]|uniref:uncharacterized protein LOC131439441 n=1 Tax=Malaya genurostris TaxID=325434 RepID=UPI0026F380D8|nr:uncharacterized protein LOC131439441 [Malaya genurostris]
MSLRVQFLVFVMVLLGTLVVESSAVNSVDRLENGRIRTRVKLANLKSQLRKSATIKSSPPELDQSIPNSTNMPIHQQSENTDIKLPGNVSTDEISNDHDKPDEHSSDFQPHHTSSEKKIGETRLADDDSKANTDTLYSPGNLIGRGGEIVLPVPPPALQEILSFIQPATSTTSVPSTTDASSSTDGTSPTNAAINSITVSPASLLLSLLPTNSSNDTSASTLGGLLNLISVNNSLTTTTDGEGTDNQLINATTQGDIPIGSSQDTGFVGAFQQIGSLITNPFGSNNSNGSSGSTSPGGIVSQFQTVGSQIAGGVTNVSSAFIGSSNSADSNNTGTTDGISSQIQNLGSQFVGGFQNVSTQITNATGIAIPTFGDVPVDNNLASGVSQDTSIIGSLQQLGSLITNPLGSNNTNSSSVSTGIGAFPTQVQNIGTQITSGFSNVSSGFQGLAGQFTNLSSISIPTLGDTAVANEVTSQSPQNTSFFNTLVQLVSSPGDENNNTNIGSTISPDILNPINISNFSNSFAITNETSSQALQDTSVIGGIQQLGSLFTNPFANNNTNSSSASAGLSGVSTQLQNLGTQISGGFTNASGNLQGLASQFPSTSGLTIPTLGDTPITNGTTSQTSQNTTFLGAFQQVGSLLANRGNNSNNGPAIASQLLNLITLSNASNFVRLNEEADNNNEADPTSQLRAEIPSNFNSPKQDDEGIHGLFQQLGTYTAPQSASQLINNLNKKHETDQNDEINSKNPNISNDVGSFTSQVQNFGAQLFPTSGALNWNSLNNIPVIGSWIGSNSNLQSQDINARPTLSCPSCEEVCGVVNTAASRRFRVVGGNSVQPPNKYPWNARFIYFNSDAGQGTLINDRAILTTATTVNNMPLFSQASALFNVYDLLSTTEERLEKKIAKVIPHPQFDSNNPYDNNIGIVLVDGLVPLSKTFVPICLPTSFDSYGGTKAIVVGWGSNTLGGHQSPVPQEVTIPLYTNYECKMANGNLSNNNLCGGIVKPASKETLVSTCEGDDGAGLMAPSRINQIQMTLIGITVQVPGKGCGETNQPAVFTNVQNFIDFIIHYGIGCGC